MTRRDEMLQRLAYRRDIIVYLAELKELTNIQVTEGMLSSLETMERIREESIKTISSAAHEFVIPFTDRTSLRFSRFVQELRKLNRSPVYIWTERTNSCGLFQVASVESVNFGFNYEVNRDGIFVILTKDLSDKMTVDFEEDETGKRVLEITLSGVNWPTARY